MPKEFNPPKNRLDVLEKCGILNFIKTTVFGDNPETNEEEHGRASKRLKKSTDDNSSEKNRTRNKWSYCDLGCNEGDLSLALSSEIMGKESSDEIFMHCLGLDIDEELIERAQSKKKSASAAGEKDSSNALRFHAEFHECNLNDAKDHMEKSEEFLKQSGITRFDLTSIFSTTMWIHIHSGDDGLVAFLERACSLTNYLLIEPQPSKCYRSVNVRLRRMNRPEEDISVDRLKMRENIEESIDRVVTSFGFKKVTIPNDEVQNSRTKWKRKLQIYKRVKL